MQRRFLRSSRSIVDKSSIAMRSFRKFLMGLSLSNEILFTPVALRPLSSLLRDGGDVRGGSCDFLIALLPPCLRFPYGYGLFSPPR
jgi:hypothetical protein